MFFNRLTINYTLSVNIHYFFVVAFGTLGSALLPSLIEIQSGGDVSLYLVSLFSKPFDFQMMIYLTPKTPVCWFTLWNAGHRWKCFSVISAIPNQTRQVLNAPATSGGEDVAQIYDFWMSGNAAASCLQVETVRSHVSLQTSDCR